MDEYRDPVLSLLIEKFEAEGPDELRGKYMQGDVISLPKSELPVVTVMRESTRIRPASNMEDEHYMPLVINVIYDSTRSLDQSDNLTKGITDLYRLIEERDDTFQLKPGTLAYVLRKYQTLTDETWISVGPNEELAITYGMGINRRGPGIFSVEAVIKCAIRIHKLRVSQL